MRKRLLNKCLSFVLCFILLTIAAVPAFASSPASENEYVLYEDSDSKVTAYETQTGDKVFLQYTDGKIVQKNIIYASNNNVIEQTFYGNGTSFTNEIKVSDYISVDYSLVPSPAAANAMSMGIIRYQALSGGQLYNYGLRCLVDTSTSQGTYTINGYVGSMATLVSIIVGAINLPISIINTYITQLLVGLGIEAVAGIIKTAVTTTVSSQTTTYTWTLIDTTAVGHTKNVYGHRYYINDSGNHYGETYYDGYLPSDWGTHSLAVWFHNEMFAYPSFSVVGWE